MEKTTRQNYSLFCENQFWLRGRVFHQNYKYIWKKRNVQLSHYSKEKKQHNTLTKVQAITPYKTQNSFLRLHFEVGIHCSVKNES